MRVILVAVGVWPDGRYEVLDYALVEQESKESWRRFFGRLMEKGLDGEQVELVVGDGRAGLGRAIGAAFPSRVRYQRCVFHKLQNLADNLSYRDLVLEAGLPAREGRQQAKRARAEAILRDAARIYATADEQVIRERLAAFQKKWGALEPKAVRCFLKDFNATLNYLRVPFPRKHLICTTNLADRFFREFRGRANEMGCFGSQTQAETLFYLVLQRDKAKRATR